MSSVRSCGWCGVEFIDPFQVVDLSWCRMHRECEREFVETLIFQAMLSEAPGAGAEPRALPVERGRTGAGPCSGQSSTGGADGVRAPTPSCADQGATSRHVRSAEAQRPDDAARSGVCWWWPYVGGALALSDARAAEWHVVDSQRVYLGTYEEASRLMTPPRPEPRPPGDGHRIALAPIAAAARLVLSDGLFEMR